jgi:hypothetical protein
VNVKVLPLEVVITNRDFLRLGRQSLSPVSKPGFVEKTVEPGKYIVMMQDGQRVTAEGSRGLGIGTKVQVLRRIDLLNGSEHDLKNKTPPLKDAGLQWKAFLPLGFGGKRAGALLKVYVESKNGEFGGEKSPAVYFVFTINTNKQGELQWSIYLKGRQVAVQVFSDMGGREDELKELVDSVEDNLRKRGFHFLAQTIRLKSPFRVPEGFRLNVKG